MKNLILWSLTILLISNCSNGHSNISETTEDTIVELDSTDTKNDTSQIRNWYNQHPAQGKWKLQKLYTHWPSKDSVIETNEIWDFSTDPFIYVYENDSLQYQYVAEWNLEVDSATSDTVWKITIVDQYTASMAFMTVQKNNDTLRLEESCENCSLYEFIK